MPWRQFRNRLSPGKINSGVGMLESGVLLRGVAGKLNVSHSVISRMRNCHPSQSWQRTREDYKSTSEPFLVDSFSTSMVSERYVLE